MSGQGKSLQDIYDDGSKRLESAELAQRQVLQDGGARGIDEIGQLEAAMMGKLDVSLGDLETEIHGYLDKACESINAAVSSEVEENRKFLERLQEALKLSCQSLSADVKQLRESIAHRFDSLSEHNLTLQRRELDKNISVLKSAGTSAAMQLKDLSQAGNTSFKSRAASHGLHAMDRSIKGPAEFYNEFSRHAISIDKRINDCVQLLTSRSKEIISELGAGQTEVQQTLDQVVQQLAAQMEEVYKEADSQLRKHCEDALSAALLYQEDLSKKLLADLLDSQQSSAAALPEKAQALSTDTTALLEQVKQLLADVDFGIRQDCESLSEEFSGKQSERLSDAREHSQMVAEERNQLMVRIAGDLLEIESNFEQRLSQLAQKCQARLSSACVDAELAIVSAHDECAADFKNLSAHQQKAIEEKTTQLLGTIDTLSQQAVVSIKQAAGDNGAAPNAAVAAEAEKAPGTAATHNPFGDFGDLKL